jgi:LysM repeat protein
MILEILAIKEINKPPEIPQPKPTVTVKVEKKKETKPKKRYYTIKQGDTLTKVSKAHRTSLKRVICANPKITNPDSIDVGERLKIPRRKDKLRCAKIKPTILFEKELSKPPVNSGGFTIAPSTGLNGYEYPSCTGYVASRRYVPAGLGNATDWYANAQARGMATGSTPQAGAIGWVYGHVVYVESVNGDGTIVISEANYDYNGSIRTITVPASQYLYIY